MPRAVINAQPEVAQKVESIPTSGSNILDYSMNSANFDFRYSDYSNDDIGRFMAQEGWRQREVGETCEKGDIMQFIEKDTNNIIYYEGVRAWIGRILSQDLLDTYKCNVFTLLGSNAKTEEKINFKTTKDFESFDAVPDNVRLPLPNTAAEAKRFFGCEVNETYMNDSFYRRYRRVYYPDIKQFMNPKFRSKFSRVFSEFTKRWGPSNLRGLIRYQNDKFSYVRGGIKYTHVRGQKNVSEEDLKKENRIRDLEREVRARPLTPDAFKYDRGIGIEIETSCPLNEEEMNRRIPIYVRCGRDGSIRVANENHHQIEFRILIKRSELEERLHRTLKVINDAGCVVNRTCGLHVHFDMRDKTPEDAERMARHLDNWLQVLHELVPISRRKDNIYCVFGISREDRRRAVNFTAFREHKTIEIRLHSGTTDYIKILSWIRLIELLMVVKGNPKSTDTIEALKELPLSDADREYWLNRHKELNCEKYKLAKFKNPLVKEEIE